MICQMCHNSDHFTGFVTSQSYIAFKTMCWLLYIECMLSTIVHQHWYTGTQVNRQKQFAKRR